MSDITNQATANAVNAYIAELQQTTRDTAQMIDQGRSDVIAILGAANVVAFFKDDDEAIEKIASVPIDAVFEIAKSQMQSNSRVRYYRRAGGVWEVYVNLDQLRLEITAKDGLEKVGAFATLAELRTYTGAAKRVNVVGDVEEGVLGSYSDFVRIADGNGRQDNNGTIVVDALNRVWMRVFDGEIDPRWFGVVGNGRNDDWPGFKNAAKFARSISGTVDISGLKLFLQSQDQSIESHGWRIKGNGRSMPAANWGWQSGEALLHKSAIGQGIPNPK